MIQAFQRVLLLIAALTVASCAGGTSVSTTSTTSSSPSRVEYYYGTSTVTSPDGKIPYGSPTVMLLRREVAPGDQRIVEVRSHGGRDHSTTMTRERGNVFSLSAGDGSISGNVTFAGPDWQWQRWSYSFRSGQVRLEGVGELDGDWHETVTYEVGSAGDRRRLTTDRLVRITRDEYDRRRSQMMTVGTSARRR